VLTPENFSIPLLFLAEQNFEDLSIRVIQTTSNNGERINLSYSVRKDSAYYKGKNILSSFTLLPDESLFSDLSSGRYTVTYLIVAGKTEEGVEQISFIIPESKSFFGHFETAVSWIRDNLLTFVWYLIEIIVFVIVLAIIIRFFIIIPLKGSRRSLKILPIINETGNADFDGPASGIDDVLMTRLQDIAELGKSEELKKYWLEDNREKTDGKSRSLNIVGGDVSLDFQKLGDISIGPVKIPLGTLSSLLLKIFGGYYISGSLQQYGSENKLILNLENRYSLIQFRKSKSNRVKYFEVSWPSETIKQKNLAEGIPEVVDQLAHKVILNLTENVGTVDWQAYKYFLQGNYLFSFYEKNRTRKDMLRDAIDKWRMSLRYDFEFAKSHYNLGVALDMDELYPDAVFRYQKAMELSPELIGREAHYNLSKIYWDIYQDESRTLAELEKIKKIDPNLSYVYNLEGLIRLKQLKYSDAINLFRKAIELGLKPDPVFYYNLSVTYYNLNQFDEAEENGQKALDLLPTEKEFTDLLQTMGWIHNRKGERNLNSNNIGSAVSEYYKASVLFNRALQEEPEKQALLDGYGEALRETGKTADAFIVQKRLLRIWPEYSRGYFEIAKTMKMLKFSELEISACSDIGNLLSDVNVVKDIILLKEKVDQTAKVSFQVNQKLMFGMLGMYYYYLSSEQTGNQNVYQQYLNNSRTYLEKSISLVSGNGYFFEPEVHHIYGIVLSKFNETANAIEELEFAINAYKQDAGYNYECAVCYSQIAKIYFSVPDYDNADKNYVKSVECYKKSGHNKKASNVHLEDAKVLMKWYWNGGNGRCYDWARKECDKAILLNHSSFEAYHVKGNTFYDFYKYPEAIPQYEMAVELNFDLPGAHYNLGLCYKNIEDYQRAANSFKIVSKLKKYYADPKNEGKEDPYLNLAKCYELMGKPDDAINLLKDVVNLFPSSAKYSILLGDYLVKSGQVTEAVNKYESAIDIDKNNEEGMLHLAFNSLANIYLDQGINFDEAERMVYKSLNLYRKTKSKNPNELCLIQNTSGWICYHKNQFKRAVFLMEKTLPALINNQRAHARLAMAYEKYSESVNDQSLKNRTKENANEQWQIVKTLNPSSSFGLMAEQKSKN
ncbi:MAG TPA: tetratricopeptide repeat protein, partial [Ignavibacteriaceae bacterium]